MTTNDVLIKGGTVLVFASAGVYSPGTNTILGTLTDDIDMVGLTADQAREGVKADLGASHAPSYTVDMTMEWATDAVGSVDLYWSESHSSTAAIGNMGNVTGADADWAGAVGMTLAESLAMLLFIGSLPAAFQNQADGVQIGHVGIFSPVQRWGVLVVHNNTADVFHSDSIEMAVRFTPIIPVIQAAV